MKSPSAPGHVPANGTNAKKRGMLAAAGERQHVVPEPPQELVERHRLGGRRARDARLHLRRRRPPERRHGVVQQALDEHVDGAVAELAHRLGVQRKPVPLHG